MFDIGRLSMLKKSTKAVWERYWSLGNHQPQIIHKELLESLLKVVNVNGKKVLEIGAGMGGDSLYLAKMGAKVTVLDFSPKALEKIRMSAKEEKIIIQTVLANAEEIPFPKETFDIVFHQGFLEHFQEPSPYLLEQRRILKKEGILAVDVPQKYTTYTIKKHIAMRRRQWFAGWEKEYTIGELEELLKKCGFEIINSYGWGYYGKLHKIRHLKIGKWYKKIWDKIEKSRLGLYLTFSIGTIAQKR